MRKSFLFIFILIFVLLGSYLVLKHLKMAPLERALERKAPEILGKADNFQVKISRTSYFNLISGHIKQVDLITSGLKIQNGPAVKKIRARFSDILFNKDQIDSIGETKFQAELSQKDINEFIAQKKPIEVHLEIELNKDEILLLSKKKFLTLNVPVKIKGALEVENKNKINFIYSEVSLGGIKIPEFIRSLLKLKANPVADLSSLPTKMTIQEILIRDKKLIMQGKIQIETPISLK